jgi:hypothetical protein
MVDFNRRASPDSSDRRPGDAPPHGSGRIGMKRMYILRRTDPKASPYHLTGVLVVL